MPSGSSKRPLRTAASSDSMPTGRPSPGAPGAWPASATAWCLRQANFGRLAQVAPAAGFRGSGRAAPGLRPVEPPARRRRARIRLPGRRASGHALRHQPRPTGRRLAGDSRSGRAGRALPPLRRGAVRGAHRPNDRRDAAPFSDRDGRAAGGARGAGRARAQGSPDAPGHAGLPGLADRRQRRAGRPGGRAGGARSCCSGRAAASRS